MSCAISFHDNARFRPLIIATIRIGMVINIHPSAADNFNKRANDLVSLVIEFPPEPSRQESFPSDLHVAATLTDKDIIGDIDVATSDYRGKTITRFFFIDGKKYGLAEENYKGLIEIAERLQSLPTIRRSLSISFVEKTLFSWICERYKQTDIPESFIKYLEDQAEEVVETITSWIPIANLEVQISFPISNSEIRPLSKTIIDKWESKLTSLSGENKENASKFFEKIKKDFQGLAAVVTVIDAEPEYASDYAIEEAQQITAVLGIFSGATLLPDIKCVSNIKGSEYIAQSTVFFENAKENIQMTSGIVDKSSAKFWRLSQRDIVEIRKTGLDKISHLLASKSLNKFEKSVLNSILLYSKSAFTADPVEKVVYMLSSMESILLKNENEPIQQNLTERVAVFTTQELKDRKSVIKTIKSVYGVRSKYLHHGHTSSELKLISDFMMRVWVFYIQLIANIDRFKTQEEFVNAIDDHKLS